MRSQFLGVPYVGNGTYCYANSTSMLLSSIGENISPSKIEVLSGVGLGACIVKGTNLLFFGWNTPDFGIDYALKILGFKVDARKISKQKLCPVEELKKDLQLFPAIVGPLDMGYLNYNFDCKNLTGEDHFVLVYLVDGEKIYLHDPAGFPCVFLSTEQLRLAWSKDVGYCKECYRYWTNPERITNPNEEKIFTEAIGVFQSLYRHSEQESKNNGWIVGEDAVSLTIQRLKKDEMSQYEIEHLTQFILPLAARRALDFASFFYSYDKTLAVLKQQQAKLFGSACVAFPKKDLAVFEKLLENISVVETEFKNELMKK